MKYLRILSATALLALSTLFTSAEQLRLMSFNIRYDNPADGKNNWRLRKDLAANAINFYDADIVGTQEVLKNQLDDLVTRMPRYAMTGVGRDDGKDQGEFAALWWKRDKFDLIDSGNFWLSSTPEEPGSLGWDGACVRIATWAILRHKESGKEIFALNTHLDHVGQQARSEGVSLILDRLNKLSGGRPVVVTGDFNSTPDSDVVAHITDPAAPCRLTDARSNAPIVYGPAWTYHDFFSLPYDKRELIDYVFTGNGLKAISYGVLAETNEDSCLSDHCQVLVNAEF